MAIKELQDRLLDRRVVDGECWRYGGSHDKCGYGRIAVGGVAQLVHRMAWLAWRGEIGEHHVLHSRDCRFRDCFRPEHLSLGTHQENMQQRDEWGNGIRGHRVAGSRLTEEQVLQAKVMRAEGMYYAAIADHFGVSASSIRHAVVGLTWRHLRGA
jgi:hypothetical protein